MKPENAIEVHGVKKKFRVYMDRGYTLKELTLFSKRRKYKERVVLEDIHFDIKKGEAVGLIGRNGCGKSTTLKLLTRIMYPDAGSIEMCGRVSSLIELGAGFHPDMTGRQNIYTNASIFGLTRKEIERRIDSIIDFSELGEAIDTPVRTYSSGMYMRLAFSVAINVDADILLIDEILAVGDASFQEKCFDKLKDIKKNGTTIVIVSHSLGQIEQICERSIWIQDGQIRMDGNAIEVDAAYLEFMAQKNQKRLKEKAAGGEDKAAQADKEKGAVEEKIQNKAERIPIHEVRTFDLTGELIHTYKGGGEVSVSMNYLNSMRMNNFAVKTGEVITLFPGGLVYGPYIALNKGRYCWEIELDAAGEIDIPARITFGAGKGIVREVQLRKGKNTVEIELEELTENIEVVIDNGGEGQIVIRQVCLIDGIEN